MNNMIIKKGSVVYELLGNDYREVIKITPKKLLDEIEKVIRYCGGEGLLDTIPFVPSEEGNKEVLIKLLKEFRPNLFYKIGDTEFIKDSEFIQEVILSNESIKEKFTMYHFDDDNYIGLRFLYGKIGNSNAVLEYTDYDGVGFFTIFGVKG